MLIKSEYATSYMMALVTLTLFFIVCEIFVVEIYITLTFGKVKCNYAIRKTNEM